jgi:hypothetical protein
MGLDQTIGQVEQIINAGSRCRGLNKRREPPVR